MNSYRVTVHLNVRAADDQEAKRRVQAMLAPYGGVGKDGIRVSRLGYDLTLHPERDADGFLNPFEEDVPGVAQGMQTDE